MAIFSRTKTGRTTAATAQGVRAITGVLLHPHLTEKALRIADRGQYTFVVRPHAEKVAIAREVAARYGVHPTRVAIVKLPGKEVHRGRVIGHRSGVKKAIVTLRSGEKIPFGVKA